VKKASPESALATSEAIGAKLDVLEQKLDRLRALYESFFLGLDKRPPEVPRSELNRLFLEMQQVPIRNAALRFRFQTLQQRWSTHLTHWNRVLREMENGTYRRDVERAQRRLAQRGETLSTDEAIALGIPVARAQAFVERHNRAAARGPQPAAPSSAASAAPPASATPPTAAASATPREDPSASAAVSDQEIARLLARWHLADRQLGRADSTPPAERLKAQLEAQIPKILSARGGTKVEFDIATKGGKVVVRVKNVV
jgi:hypothetical protein